MKNYLPPFHLCRLSREVGSLLYIGARPDSLDERVKKRTNREMRNYVNKRHPGSIILLGSAGQFMGDGWEGPESVAMLAVCDKTDVDPSGTLVLAFILGGIVPKGTIIPPGHMFGSGCIPFDIEHVWSDALDQFKRSN